jgi:hypothetical protein
MLITTSLFVLFISIVATQDSSGAVVVIKNKTYPLSLIRTSLTCTNQGDAECLAYNNNTWCGKGITCIAGICHRIPSYPCLYTKICNETAKQCQNKTCQYDHECDDGIRCNGFERCVNHICISDFKAACH